MARPSAVVPGCPPGFGLSAALLAARPGPDLRIKSQAQPWPELSESVQSFGMSRHLMPSWSDAIRLRSSVLLLALLLGTGRPSAFRPDISPVGANLASVMHWRRPLLPAVGRCCCGHCCYQPRPHLPPWLGSFPGPLKRREDGQLLQLAPGADRCRAQL